ncbi:MAG: hypothetical protein E7671_04525 [Ruminococcaceae bacterium]|nr:hypothetical protein [Oscillospiraceae bacterium]
MSSSKNGLVVYRSADNGDTWSEGAIITDESEDWNDPTLNPWIEDGYVNIAATVTVNLPGEIHDGWNLSARSLVLMRAKVTDDLTKKESWSFSNRVRFRDLVKEDELDLHGISFFTTTLHKHDYSGGRTTDSMTRKAFP